MIDIVVDIIKKSTKNLDFNKVDSKSDGSLVTEVDQFVESVVIHELKKHFDNLTIIGEESPEEIKQGKYLLTVDGIDGTNFFVKKNNDKWMLGLTSVYENNKPVLSFAYQPQLDRLYCLAENNAVCIVNLNDPQIFPLSMKNIGNIPYGTIEIGHKLQHDSIIQRGPSGYNMASILATCAGFDSKVNFTSFNYKLWDMGLWGILNHLGFESRLLVQKVDLLDLNWFSERMIRMPLFIAPPELMPSVLEIFEN